MAATRQAGRTTGRLRGTRSPARYRTRSRSPSRWTRTGSATSRSTPFGRPHYAGYWAQGAAHDPELGWLVAECDEHERFPGKTETARVEALWRAGEPLPKRWYRLDRAAALRMWEEGVKRYGVDWHGSNEHDGGMEDVLLQLTLLSEIRYG